MNRLAKEFLKNLRKLKMISHNKENNNTEAMDKLLDKISKSGYEGLTKKEKEELFNCLIKSIKI